MADLATSLGVLAVFVIVPIVFFILILAVAKRYKKVGPNQVMVISGRKHTVENTKGQQEITGFRIRKGGGAFIFPLLERVDILSLEVMTLDFTTPEVYTKPGVPIVVDGVAQVKIRGDESSIRTAAEQFLGKNVEEMKTIALQTVEGHLRAIIGTLSVEEIYRNRDQFASSVQEVAVSDLANMGLQIVSFTLKDIRDSHGYLDALGKPRTAEIKRDAIIAVRGLPSASRYPWLSRMSFSVKDTICSPMFGEIGDGDLLHRRGELVAVSVDLLDAQGADDRRRWPSTC